MAKKEERRKAFWEEEEEDENEIVSPKLPHGAQPEKGAQRTGSLGFIDGDQVDKKIHEAKVLLEQTHQLYQQYFTGAQKLPPVQKASLLETKAKEFERMTSSGAVSRFKITQYLQQYHSLRELWDRKLREKEKASG